MSLTLSSRNCLLISVMFHTVNSYTCPHFSYRKGSGAVYPKLYASILPLVLPLLLAVHGFGFNPIEADWGGDLVLKLCVCSCLAVSLLVMALYPEDGRLSGWPLGDCGLKGEGRCPHECR